MRNSSNLMSPFLQSEHFSEKKLQSDSSGLQKNLRFKTTLLDRLVSNVFGPQHKIYEKYPTLEQIIVPKYPVIKPKGNEIINRD